jgi:hypothetical protein
MLINEKSLMLKDGDQEVVAKHALEVKFDDFFIGWIRGKSTYPGGRRRFAADPTNEKSANLAPNGVL